MLDLHKSVLERHPYMAKSFNTNSSSSTFFILISLLLCITLAIKAHDLHFNHRLRNDSEAIKLGSSDYGNLVHEIPSAVLYPSSVNEIRNLIKLSNRLSTPFTVAAKGRGHSVRGQAMARDGVVVDMTAFSEHGSGTRVFGNDESGYYADVSGGELWINVLHATLEHGVAPVSWTDYLYVTVGGTLSNAGIGGQSFSHGPQISNVLELDVITGKFTCRRFIYNCSSIITS